jgi:hypothetical protein
MWVTADPGESTGYATWDGDDLIEAGTMAGWEFVDWLQERVEAREVELVVIEDWVLYPWAAESLIWDHQRTVRIIGAIELLARQHMVELVHQPAKIKEAAEAGGAANLFLKPLHPNRHANDAIRHGVYHLQAQRVQQ